MTDLQSLRSFEARMKKYIDFGESLLEHTKEFDGEFKVFDKKVRQLIADSKCCLKSIEFVIDVEQFKKGHKHDFAQDSKNK